MCLKDFLFLADSEPHIVEDAVKYIIFLVDANSLFDTALGMYDFSLVLMIAQHAQKVRLIICVTLIELSHSVRIPENIYHSCGSSERCQNSTNGSESMTISGDIPKPCLILAQLVSIAKDNS